jgi:hypothetical protein
MAQEKFNKGDWKRSHRRRTFTKTHVVTITSSDKWLAQVHGDTLIEAEANAALIAAAPAMYEALKLAHKNLQGQECFLSQKEWEQIEAALSAANPETINS